MRELSVNEEDFNKSKFIIGSMGGFSNQFITPTAKYEKTAEKNLSLLKTNHKLPPIIRRGRPNS